MQKEKNRTSEQISEYRSGTGKKKEINNKTKLEHTKGQHNIRINDSLAKGR